MVTRKSSPISNVTSMNDHPVETTGVVDVELFDPPMCCPTGRCGTTLDQTLLDVSEMLLARKAANVRVERAPFAHLDDISQQGRGGR